MNTDLILENARVITMDPRRPFAEAVAIENNRIALTGSRAEVRLTASPATRIIDCGGMTMLPGFIDAHCHLYSLLRNLLNLDLHETRSIAEIQSALCKRAPQLAAGQWLVGMGFHEFDLAEKRSPDRYDIDRVINERPVLLMHRSLHSVVLNSRALALAGINVSTPEPEGVIFERDANGEPNGIISGMLDIIRNKIIPELGSEELATGAELVNRYYLSNGITSIQDASVTNDPERWRTLNRFKERGAIASRLRVMSGIDKLAKFRDAGLQPGSGNDHCRLGGVKIMLTEASGKLAPAQEVLNSSVQEAHNAGWQTAIHAVSLNEVEAAITALESIKEPGGVARLRHRIEHCSECSDFLLERLVKIKPCIVSQPPFIYFNGERYLSNHTPGELKTLYRFSSWLKANLHTGGSSDSPVAPATPLYGLYAAVTRHAANGIGILENERVTVYEALHLYTQGAAYCCFDEKIKGSLAPGKLADIVLLDRNPFECEPEQLLNVKVKMTIIDGKIVWQA